jgi:hypothetical protein
MINAARTAQDGNSNFPGGGIDQNGAAYESSSFPTTAGGAWGRAAVLALLDGIEEGLIEWDEQDVPQPERFVYVNPRCWHALKNLGLPRATTEVPGASMFMGNRDFNPSNPDFAQLPARDRPLVFNDVLIYRTNFLPTTNVTTGESKYQGDFTDTRAIMIQKQAVAHLTLMDVMTETARLTTFGTDFFVTKMLTGGGTLRPECAIEFQYDAAASGIS